MHANFSDSYSGALEYNSVLQFYVQYARNAHDMSTSIQDKYIEKTKDRPRAFVSVPFKQDSK